MQVLCTTSQPAGMHARIFMVMTMIDSDLKKWEPIDFRFYFLSPFSSPTVFLISRRIFQIHTLNSSFRRKRPTNHLKRD